ncbi:MAG: MFS transporter, partial [Clostridia bacterium]
MKNVESKLRVKKEVPTNIILLGLVSMFIDMSTEMVYPIMPMFLVALGATPSIIGVIEGITEGLATVLRAFAGYITDKFHKKKAITMIGYSSAFFYKIGIIFSVSWVGVFFSKLVDRIGKGLRTAPRDSLIAESAKGGLGKNYGLHKMFDMLGATLGVLLAYIILVFSAPYKTVFYVSLVPAVIGVFILTFVKENRLSDNFLKLEKSDIYVCQQKTEKTSAKTSQVAADVDSKNIVADITENVVVDSKNIVAVGAENVVVDSKNIVAVGAENVAIDSKNMA